MDKEKYEVKIYHSGYTTHIIEAENESVAIIEARSLPINQKEFSSTLENWNEADEARKI